MKRLFGCFSLACAALLVSGCAGLTVESAADESKDAAVTGFRYYETAPFLLIYSDNKGGLTSKVLYLPDMTKKRSIRAYNYLASNNTTFKFEDGKLTGAKAVVDETAIPSAVLSGLEKIATSAVKAAAANSGSANIPGPYLFRILKVDGKWKLAGCRAIDAGGSPISIRFLPQ